MKKLANIALTLFSVIAIGTSCGVNEEIEPVYQSLGTIIENTAGSKTPYYVLFDDGKSAYVTNNNEWNPTFKNGVTELRYLISYEITSETSIGFDQEVRIVAIKECMPTLYSLPVATAEDFTGNNGLGLQNYTGSASVEACFIAPASNYMTLTLWYNIATELMTQAPKIILIKNTPENSPYKDLYADDNYYYLELYHDDSEYLGTNQYTTNLSCKMLMPNIQQMLDTYTGVKIISKNHNTSQPEVFKFNFTTEENQTAAQ